MRRAIPILAAAALLLSACPSEWTGAGPEVVARIAPTVDPLDDPEVQARLAANHEARVAAFAPTTPDPTPAPTPVRTARPRAVAAPRHAAAPIGGSRTVNSTCYSLTSNNAIGRTPRMGDVA